MEVMLTVGDTDEDYFMAVATKDEWRELLRNLDGIGHSPTTMKLIAGLKGWGVSKH